MNEGKAMVSDQEIAKSLETLLRQADPNAVTTLAGVVQQLEAQLGQSLTHKAGFIRDQINNHLLILRSQPPPPPPKDHFALQHPPQFPNHHHPNFALHPHHHHHQPQPPDVLHLQSPLPPLLHNAAAHSHQLLPQPQQQSQVLKPQPRPNVLKTSANTWEMPKERSQGGIKRRGGPGGLNKVCGVTPELQAVVGQPALPRTEIVKQLWIYIRKNNLQDPSNKRKIICDDALRVVFETDSTDMFKMNKLLAKHIIPLEPTKEAGQAKRKKVDVESAADGTESAAGSMVISEALARFLGTGEMEIDKPKAERCVWEYIKANHLEDPVNPMVIVCDAKLQGLFGCQSISAIGIQELLSRHMYKR